MTGQRHRKAAPRQDPVQKPVSIAVAVRRAGSWLVIALIRFYQLTLSPIFPASCRYTPTCSQYALEAVRKYGALKGGWIGLRRVLRCHPFHPGGYDPVP